LSLRDRRLPAATPTTASCPKRAPSCITTRTAYTSPPYNKCYLLTHRVNPQARLVASGSPLACRNAHHCVLSKTGPFVLHHAVFLMGLAANCTNKRQMFNVRQSCGKDSDPVFRNIQQVRIYIYIIDVDIDIDIEAVVREGLRSYVQEHSTGANIKICIYRHRYRYRYRHRHRYRHI